MTVTTSASDDVQPGDIFFVDPFAVEIREGLHTGEMPTKDAILEMAISLHDHGQRRAVECRNVDGHLLLDHGFIRAMAARLICTGFRYTDPGTNAEVKVKDKRFRLKVVFLEPTVVNRP